MTQEQLDAEEAMVLLQLGERKLLDWMQWKFDCFVAEHGDRPKTFMLTDRLYRDYLDEIVGNIHWQAATTRYMVDYLALMFAGIPVIRGDRCLVS